MPFAKGTALPSFLVHANLRPIKPVNQCMSDVRTNHEDFGGDGADPGGLLGMLAGGMMGGPLAAVTKLSAAGLSMDQIKAAGDHHAGLCQGQGGRSTW